MELNEWSERIERVSAGYGEYYGVDRTPEWILLKLTEELGELTQAHLSLTGQGRHRGRSPEELRHDLEGEVADVLAMVLVYARSAGIDAEAALTGKWLPWEEFHARRAAGQEVPDPLPHRWPLDPTAASDRSGCVSKDDAHDDGAIA